MFDEMWEQIHNARRDRSRVSEFRMHPDTRRGLLRALESRQTMRITPGVETAFGIRIVSDPRVPVDVVVPITAQELSFAPTFGDFSFYDRPAPTPDESHGMTIDELLDGIDRVLAEVRAVESEEG